MRKEYNSACSINFINVYYFTKCTFYNEPKVYFNHVKYVLKEFIFKYWNCKTRILSLKFNWDKYEISVGSE